MTCETLFYAFVMTFAILTVFYAVLIIKNPSRGLGAEKARYVIMPGRCHDLAGCSHLASYLSDFR